MGLMHKNLEARSGSETAIRTALVRKLDKPVCAEQADQFVPVKSAGTDAARLRNLSALVI